MKNPDAMLDTVKEWITAANPGLVTQADLARLETRIDELDALLTAIEEKLHADKPQPPRP